MRKKILFLIPNLATIGNWVSKLMPFLSNEEIIILHLAQLQGKEAPIVEKAKSIDISSFNYEKIKKLIEFIKPDVFIIFSFRSVLEQLFILIGRENNIKTVYLEHGILNEDSEHFRSIKGLKNILDGLKRHLNYCTKYIQFSLNTKNSLSKLRYLYFFYTKNQFRNNPFNWYFVYGERCLNYLGKIYDIKLGENAKIVGYPLFSSNEDKLKALESISNNPNGVLYIHQPLIEDGYAKISYLQEKELIVKIADKTKNLGELTVLLHPRANIETYTELFNGTNIKVIKSSCNYVPFLNKKLVVGHYSTALLFPMFLGIKTVRTEFPTVKHHSIFDEYLEFIDFEISNVNNLEVNLFNSNYEMILGKENTYSHIAKEIISIC